MRIKKRFLYVVATEGWFGSDAQWKVLSWQLVAVYMINLEWLVGR